MPNQLTTLQRVTIAGIVSVALLGAAASPTAAAEAGEPLIWLRANACNRAERSIGHVDLDGECVADHPAFDEDVTICAGHFCAAAPREPGARIIHPTDFGPTT